MSRITIRNERMTLEYLSARGVSEIEYARGPFVETPKTRRPASRGRWGSYEIAWAEDIERRIREGNYLLADAFDDVSRLSRAPLSEVEMWKLQNNISPYLYRAGIMGIVVRAFRENFHPGID